MTVVAGAQTYHEGTVEETKSAGNGGCAPRNARGTASEVPAGVLLGRGVPRAHEARPERGRGVRGGGAARERGPTAPLASGFGAFCVGRFS